jgi:predicted ATPase
VAELVSRGLTNRQMAAALFISERTVEGHVEQILNALGLRSRTQIAAWFVREQLAAAPAIGMPVAGPVTLLMAELAGFPPSPDGSEPWPRQRFAELTAIRARRHGGLVSDLGGEPRRIVAMFPRPAQAVECALDLHQAVAAAYWTPGSRSSAWIALHLADPWPAGDPPPPQVMRECGSLLGLGEDGQTVVSAAVESALGGPLDATRPQLRLAGGHALGGRAEPVAVYDFLEGESAQPALPATGRDRPTNLPQPLTSFVNREVELADLRELLDHSRLVTLVGPGGVGKTRLALQLAASLVDAFPDGVWLVELDQVADARLVTQAVAGVVRVREVPGTPLRTTLVEELSERRALLVLDNCEHVVSACAELVEALLTGCPLLVGLATSREPLGVRGERIWQVVPLAHPDPGQAAQATMMGRYPAMRLFVDRARASQPSFRLTTANTAAVAQISSRLEGIPLAIELAAAWTRMVGVDELLERLEDRLGLLTGGARTAPARHRTLAAAIDWSDQLLDGRERLLFHRLSVFAASFRPADVEAVCAGGPDSASFALLARLVDQSLVLGEGGRYRCLETIRDYGRRQLAAAGELEELQARHARHFARVVTTRDVGETGAWLERLREVQADVRAALQWSIGADPDLALTMVESLHDLWLYTGRPAEARQWTEGVAAVAGDPASRARALAVSAMAAYSQSDIAAGAAMADEAGRLASTVGDDDILAKARRVQGLLAMAADDPAPALAFCAEALALYQRSGHRAGETDALYSLGLVTGFTGDLATAQTLFERSLEIRTEMGSRDEGVAVLAFLGLVQLATGLTGAARAAIEESVLAARQIGDRRAAWTLDVAACLAATEGDPRRAIQLAAAGHEMHRTAGVRPPPVWQRSLDAWLDSARRHVGAAEAASARAAGAALTFDEALDRALTGPA